MLWCRFKAASTIISATILICTVSATSTQPTALTSSHYSSISFCPRRDFPWLHWRLRNIYSSTSIWMIICHSNYFFFPVFLFTYYHNRSFFQSKPERRSTSCYFDDRLSGIESKRLLLYSGFLRRSERPKAARNAAQLRFLRPFEYLSAYSSVQLGRRCAGRVGESQSSLEGSIAKVSEYVMAAFRKGRKDDFPIPV